MTAFREPIWAGFFDYLSAVPGFKTRSRLLRHWSEVTAAEQPALFLMQNKNAYVQRRGLPAKIKLMGEIVVYSQAPNDGKTTPDTQLNALLDAIDDTLKPSPATGVQTLGGLVSHAWISGSIDTSGGLLNPQAVAVIPVSLLTNS